MYSDLYGMYNQQDYPRNYYYPTNSRCNPRRDAGTRLSNRSDHSDQIRSLSLVNATVPRGTGTVSRGAANSTYNNNQSYQQNHSRRNKRGNRHINESNKAKDVPLVYSCPTCKDIYSFKYRNYKPTGKIPLILHCNHTVCVECIYKNTKSNIITCSVCYKDSRVTLNSNSFNHSMLLRFFCPNYYIIGIMAFYDNQAPNINNLENVKFVEPLTTKSDKSNDEEICAFNQCTNEATMWCSSCEALYCSDCCDILHSSINKLHQPIPNHKVKMNIFLSRCTKHPQMWEDFLCKNCDVNACCYCVLDKHASHEREELIGCLSEAENAELKALRKQAEIVFKQLQTTKKKVSNLIQFNNTSLKKDICLYFAELHAKLTSIEKKLCSEADNFQTTTRNVKVVQNSIAASSNLLKELISINENDLKENKYNLKLVLAELRKIHNIPRFLLTEKGTDPLRFVVDSAAIDSLNGAFSLEKNQFQYELSGDNENNSELSSNSNQSDLSEEESISSLSTKSSQKLTQHDGRKHFGMDKVSVQHINSLDSFYIQYKNDQPVLASLRDQIDNYVKIGGAQTVSNPLINDLYLALYIADFQTQTKKEECWCRARLINIKNNEMDACYEVFFIDYGKTQIVDSNRIRDLPNFLASKKPFAVECRLHNPMGLNWSKDSNLTFAKILNGKDICMVMKSIENSVYIVDLMIATSDGSVTSVIDILVHSTHCVTSANNQDLVKSPFQSKASFYSPITIFPNSCTFEKNYEYLVTIANVVDPFNIFVHLNENKEAFKTLCHNIKKAYRKTHPSIPVEGIYVIVEHKDDVRLNHHRAFIKHVNYKDDEVQVHLVDWGVTVLVRSEQVRQIPEHLTKMESQAILVKMAHIAPYNKTANWSPSANVLLNTYYKTQDLLKMMLHEKAPHPQVALFDISGNVNQCLNTLMVEKNLADSTGSISTQLNWVHFQPQISPQREETDLLSTLLRKADETCDDSEDDENVLRKQVDILKVENPDVIWLKFVALRDRDNTLYKDLQVHYTGQKHLKQNSWAVGDLCVAEVENEFARGKIYDILDTNYAVFLYDKAEKVIVTPDKLYIFDTYFSTYPEVAIKAHLNNIKPAGDTGKWSISAIEALQEIVTKHKKIFASLTKNEHSSRKSLPVELWYCLINQVEALVPTETKFVSINKVLVRLGVAYKTNISISMAKNGEDLLKTLAVDDDPPVENITKEDEALKTSAEDDDTLLSCPPVENVTKEDKALKTSAEDDDTLLSCPPVEKVTKEDKALKTSEQDDDTLLSWSDLVEKELHNFDCKSQDVSTTLPSKKSIDNWPVSDFLTKRKFTARVTCAETGGHLYIREESMNEQYLKLELAMKEYFESNPPSPTFDPWQPGDLCTIKYSDGNWYRGRVLKVESPKNIVVLMIDFGSDHECKPDVLFKELIYTDIGCLNNKLKLNKVYSKNKNWLSSDYDYFQELLTDWCTIEVQGSLEVELPLVEVYNSNGIHVNEELVKICPNLYRNVNLIVEQSSMTDDESIVIESIESCESLDGEITKENPEKNLELEEMCANSTYRIKNLPGVLLSNNKMELTIGGALSYDKVALKVPEELCPEMLNMMLDIQDSIETFPQLTSFNIGTPCLAEFSEDHVWYRAKITENAELTSGLVDVFYVDYGNSETVSITTLKEIKAHFLKKPQDTWEAALNIKLLNEEQSADILEVFKKLSDSNLQVKLIKEEPLTVELYTLEGKLVYQDFIDCGIIEIPKID